MPADTVEATPLDSKETFAAYHGSRGSAVPADVEVKLADVTDTGEAKPDAAGDDEKPKPVSESATPPQDSKVEKRKAKIQSDIDALVAKREEVRREIDSLKPKSAASASAAASQDDPEPKAPKAVDAKYQGDDGWEKFRVDEQRYTIDKAKWEIRQDEAKKSAQAALEQQQKNHKEALDKFEERGSEFSTEHDDYPDLVDKFKARQISQETAAVIVNTENGPAILYELMSKPDEMRRIESLPTPIAKLEALFELRYRLAGWLPASERKDPATPKPKSAAPATGTRLNGTGGGGSKEPESFNVFRKQRFA